LRSLRAGSSLREKRLLGMTRHFGFTNFVWKKGEANEDGGEGEDRNEDEVQLWQWGED
jgi:hypothetical protein